jgi:mutator protein MutT
VADPYTHAGGVVFRRDAGAARFLLVTARRAPGEWVLPKGHIEPGETAEEAAVREVAEEAGVTARLLNPVGALDYRSPRGRVHVVFYLMEFERDVPATEERRIRWLAAEEARRALGFDDARRLVAAAERALAIIAP